MNETYDEYDEDDDSDGDNHLGVTANVDDFLEKFGSRKKEPLFL